MKTVLLADDEPFYEEALRARLESMGLNVVVRRDATSTWEYLEDEEVSVLVTDIMMPPGPKWADVQSSEAGFHLVEMVRRHYPRVHVICLSVIGDQAKIDHLKRKGALYLRKGETSLEVAAKLIESKVLGYRDF